MSLVLADVQPTENPKITEITVLKEFEGMTNNEIISEFVECDDSFAIMVDEVNGTVNIELSLDFWNSPYQKGGE